MRRFIGTRPRIRREVWAILIVTVLLPSLLNAQAPTVSTTLVLTAGSCVEDPLTMCLINSRYKVTSHWKNQYAGGAVSDLNKTRLTDETGAFWLSDSSSFEYLIRINTATNNGHAWITITMFTDVEFWVAVTDTANGTSKEYHSLPGKQLLIYDPLSFVYP
jgi:hypothetical protein